MLLAVDSLFRQSAHGQVQSRLHMPIAIASRSAVNPVNPANFLVYSLCTLHFQVPHRPASYTVCPLSISLSLSSNVLTC